MNREFGVYWVWFVYAGQLSTTVALWNGEFWKKLGDGEEYSDADFHAISLVPLIAPELPPGIRTM